MALDTNLLKFTDKGSGVYRELIDRSQIPNVGGSTTTPLIVGFSKKGPFNTPIVCTDREYFISVFGNIDKSLEKRGSFFHRSAIELLELGPVICVNLYNLNQSVPEDPATEITDVNFDLTEFQPISTSAGEKNGSSRIKALASFYDREKFWFPDVEEFLGTAGAQGKLLNFVNLSQRSKSVIVVKSELTGFEVTAREWYGTGEIPEFMDPLDYISDYMIDVYLFDGDYTDYVKLSTDPILGSFFDKDKGFIKSKLSEFVNLPEVSLSGLYQGALIPNFADKNGRNLFIETIINSETSRTGLFCAVDTELFDNQYLSGVVGGVDLLGHTLEGIDARSVDFLSYKDTIVSDIQYEKTELSDITLSDTVSVNAFSDLLDSVQITGSPSNVLYIGNDVDKNVGTKWVDYIVENFGENVSYVQYNGSDWTKIKSITQVTNGIELEIDSSLSYSGTTFSFIEEMSYLVSFPTGPNPERYIAAEGSTLYKDWQDGTLTNGDIVAEVDNSGAVPVVTNRYIKLTEITDNYNGSIVSGSEVTAVKLEMYTSEELLLTGSETLDSVFLDFGESYLSDNTQPSPSTDLLIVQTLKGSLNEQIPATETLQSNVVEISDISKYSGKFIIGDLIVSEFGNDDNDSTNPSRLTRISSVTEDATRDVITVTGQAPIAVNNGFVEKYEKIEEFVDWLDFKRLYGYRIKERSLPNSTASRINEIYNLLSGTGLFKGLIDKDIIQYRYIVDTMIGTIEPETKSQLTNLARRRENAFAICNMPSTKQFSKSSDPRFTEAPTASVPRPSVEARYISTGGNLSLNPSATFSLPSIQNGASFSAFYGPFVVVRERGKEQLVPPAAYVTKNFIAKYSVGNPWDIVAGPRRGIISGNNVVGVENAWDSEDRGYLENFGYNPIVNERGIGLVIKSNGTSQQSVKSALSSINVIEAIIFLQDTIAERLRSYVWEFNTPQTRLEIKTLADEICLSVQNDGGIDNFDNVMNRSNNNRDVIERELGVLDTYIEPIFGLGKIVHRTTVLRGGEIEAGFVQGL